MRKLLTLLSVCAGVVSYAQSICGGSSTTLTAGNPQNLANPQYSLNPGGFSPINGTSQFQVSPSTTTNYTLYTTGQNTANVVVTTSAVVQVTVFPQPIVAPTLTQASCTSTIIGFNLGLTFNPPTPAPGYTIAWLSIPNGVLSAQQTSVASGVLPGPYPATVTAAGGCQLFFTITLNAPPAPANFSLTPFASTLTLNCITPTIDIAASDPSYGYTWTSTSSLPVNDYSVNLNSTNLGTWTVIGQNPNSLCTKTLTFTLVQNITPPTSTISPLSQVITCTSGISTVSMTASPTINIAHYITDPQQGIFTANSHTAIYSPGSVGEYTYIVINLENGCSTTKFFSVTSTQGFPTYSLQSQDSFTLGCNTKSVATINIVGASASQPGAGVSYTIIGPPTSTNVIGGTLSGNSTYTVNVPGNYTVIVRELPSNCETRSSISIIQKTAAPDIVASSSLIVLDCDHTVTVLQGTSDTENISYNWSYQTFNVQSSTVQVNINTASNTQTLINNYTLTITDNSSTCKSTTVFPIFQNLYPPKPQFSLGTFSITCLTPTIVLTNISISTIKPNFPILPPSLPVIALLWQGPTPQDPLALSTVYQAGINGTYTLTAKDLNNGCIATATQSVEDYRDYPVVTFSVNSFPLDCGAYISLSPEQTLASPLSPAWTTPNNAASGPRNVPKLINVGFVGIYTLTVSDTKNGCVSSKTISVTKGGITAKFDVDKMTGYAPLTVNLVNNSSTSVGNASITSYYNLSNGTFSTTTQTSIAVSTVFNFAGTYSIALTVAKGECIDTMVKFIKVELPSSIEIPNVFTPNGDGINDVYFLNATNLGEVTFVIHDRWGHLIYELTSLTGNITWDGKTQTGVEASEGVFFYTLKATGTDGNTFDKSGTITLIR